LVVEEAKSESEVHAEGDVEKAGTKMKTLDMSARKEISIFSGKGTLNVEAIREVTEMGRSVEVAACGPESLMLDVRNGCADAQARILSGKSVGASEV
jgi:hypothetical protein